MREEENRIAARDLLHEFFSKLSLTCHFCRIGDDTWEQMDIQNGFFSVVDCFAPTMLSNRFGNMWHEAQAGHGVMERKFGKNRSALQALKARGWLRTPFLAPALADLLSFAVDVWLGCKGNWFPSL